MVTSTKPPVTYCFQTSPAENILPLLKILYSCYHDARHAVCANLLEAVMGLLAPRQEDMDKNAHQLRHLLTEGFADPEFRAVDAMAQLHLNEDYLRRCFKKELGVTPQAYLNQLRIENGKKLLEKADGTGMSVAEIAHLSGFYDPLYFSRVFRSITGCSPQEWKQKHSHAL